MAISVDNDGEPIPPDQQKSIFKSMTRGSGSGIPTLLTNLLLGRFITHKIITAHGGTISVHSAPLVGKTLDVILPRQSGESICG